MIECHHQQDTRLLDTHYFQTSKFLLI